MGFHDEKVAELLYQGGCGWVFEHADVFVADCSLRPEECKIVWPCRRDVTRIVELCCKLGSCRRCSHPFPEFRAHRL